MLAFGLSRSRSQSSFALIAMLVAAAGCGEAPEVKVPVTPVTGTLTVAGEKAIGARVTLHPQGHPLPEGRSAGGVVQPDGSFQVSLYDDPKGVPAGEYVATVDWYKPIKTDTGAGAGPNVIPKTYSSVDSSPIKVSVKDAPVAIPPIDIKK